MYKKNLTNKRVIKAMTLGIAAALAVTAPMTDVMAISSLADTDPDDTSAAKAEDAKEEKVNAEEKENVAETAKNNAATEEAKIESENVKAEDEEIMELLDGREAILLVTKNDLMPVFPSEMLKERFSSFPLCFISTKEETGLAELGELIAQKVYGKALSTDNACFVDNERQAYLLGEAKKHLEAALQTIDMEMGEDFISIDLRSAWEKLGEITGETAGEDIIDQIFSQFCIGK